MEEVIKNAKIYEERLSKKEPLNISKGYTWFTFNTEQTQDGFYKHNPQKILLCRNYFSQTRVGFDNSEIVYLNVSPFLYQRICYYIVKVFGIDMIPMNVNVVVYRFDRFDEIKEKNLKEIGKRCLGRVRYLIAIFKDNDFLHLTKKAKFKKDFTIFNDYLL